MIVKSFFFNKGWSDERMLHTRKILMCIYTFSLSWCSDVLLQLIVCTVVVLCLLINLVSAGWDGFIERLTFDSLTCSNETLVDGCGGGAWHCQLTFMYGECVVFNLMSYISSLRDPLAIKYNVHQIVDRVKVGWSHLWTIVFR